MAKVEPTKIVVIQGSNHKASQRLAIDLLKAKVTAVVGTSLKNRGFND